MNERVEAVPAAVLRQRGLRLPDWTAVLTNHGARCVCSTAREQTRRRRSMAPARAQRLRGPLNQQSPCDLLSMSPHAHGGPFGGKQCGHLSVQLNAWLLRPGGTAGCSLQDLVFPEFVFVQNTAVHRVKNSVNNSICRILETKIRPGS